MLKILRAAKDTYITNKVVKNERKLSSNVGAAGTLDLFKLYGASTSGSTPNTELSRILVDFDLNPLRDLLTKGLLDTNDSSFWCKIKLTDVYGGQPTPTDFTLSVFPLSASFQEGIGKDVSYYTDYDIANWLTSSLESQWFVSGCGLACDAQAAPGDYVTSSISIANTEVTQKFTKGDEDLYVDVTQIVSATLAGEIPESGFRISFNKSLEDNTKTYFVKRFASCNAFDESKRPKLIVGFDDSISDDTVNLTFDKASNLTLYNYVDGELSNLTSGSSLTQLTGDDCIKLRLLTEISGGFYEKIFSGSQFKYGQQSVSGTYQASVTLLSSDPIFSNKLNQSGSINFVPVWSSNDMSVGFVTGSTVTARPSVKSGSREKKNLVVSVVGLKEEYLNDAMPVIRLSIFDESSPYIKLVKVPSILKGVVFKNVHYQIRNDVSGEIVVPFDDVKNSTKVSSDAVGMFFKFDCSSLVVGNSYVFDIMINNGGTKEKYMRSSANFRIASAGS